MQKTGYQGNLSGTERTWSAVLGTGLSLLVLRSGNPILRALAAVAGAGLLSRAFAGHCAVKATIKGETSLGEGIRDQWQRLSGRQNRMADTQQAVEEWADPAAVEEGRASEPASASGLSAARH